VLRGERLSSVAEKYPLNLIRIIPAKGASLGRA